MRIHAKPRCFWGTCWPWNRHELYLHGNALGDGPSADEPTGNLLEQRKKGVPLQYLRGYCFFESQRIRVDSRALIPRPETELLVQIVHKRFPLRGVYEYFADIGTGTGCITLALARRFPQGRFWSTDACPEALELARTNVELAGVSEKVTLRLGYFDEAFESQERFGALVANPPYLSPVEMQQLPSEGATRAFLGFGWWWQPGDVLSPLGD